MYQTTTTRPAARPQISGPFMLAGRQVARELFDAAQSAKRAGRRVALVVLTEHADEMDVPAGVCVNCLGAEHLGLEVFVAGPFRDASGGHSTSGVAEDAAGMMVRPAWHNGAWWQVARRFAPCPVCGPKVVEL